LTGALTVLEGYHHCRLYHLMLQQDPKWFDVLIPA